MRCCCSVCALLVRQHGTLCNTLPPARTQSNLFMLTFKSLDGGQKSSLFQGNVSKHVNYRMEIIDDDYAQYGVWSTSHTAGTYYQRLAQTACFDTGKCQNICICTLSNLFVLCITRLILSTSDVVVWAALFCFAFRCIIDATATENAKIVHFHKYAAIRKTAPSCFLGNSQKDSIDLQFLFLELLSPKFTLPGWLTDCTIDSGHFVH